MNDDHEEIIKKGYVDRLLDEIDRLWNENGKLKEEVQILTEALRDLQWKLDRLNK